MAQKVFAPDETNGHGRRMKRQAIEHYWTFPHGTASLVYPGDGTIVVHSADPPKKRGKLKEIKDNG